MFRTDFNCNNSDHQRTHIITSRYLILTLKYHDITIYFLFNENYCNTEMPFSKCITNYDKLLMKWKSILKIYLVPGAIFNVNLRIFYFTSNSCKLNPNTVAVVFAGGYNILQFPLSVLEYIYRRQKASSQITGDSSDSDHDRATTATLSLWLIPYRTKFVKSHVWES